MVGTGIFTSLGFQVEALPSPFLILSLWVLGGVAAFCGAVSYAELSAMLPRSGGEYHFLSKIYHPALGFMAAIVSIVVGFAAPIALSAMAFGSYLSGAFPKIPAGAAALAAVLAVTAAHAVSVKASGVFQVSVTAIKLLLVGCFLAAGFYAGSAVDFLPRGGDAGLFFSGAYAVSLMYVMYAYWGWNAAAYIIGEVRDPQKTVPAALLIATVAATALYVLLNVVFLSCAPMAEFAGKIDVGKIAAGRLWGEAGGRVMSGIIAVGLLSVMSAMTWAGPRVAQIVGRDFPSLAVLGRTSEGGVPRPALALQTSIVLVLLLTGSFSSVLLYTAFALTACSFLTVAGVIVMRVRKPDLDRPFRCWGYPVTPLVFLAITGMMLGYSAVQKPAEAAAGCATLTAGLGLYALARPGRAKPPK